MIEKEIIDGKYPNYSFRLDPAIIKELEKLKGERSWNHLIKQLIKANEVYQKILKII